MLAAVDGEHRLERDRLNAGRPPPEEPVGLGDELGAVVEDRERDAAVDHRAPCRPDRDRPARLPAPADQPQRLGVAPGAEDDHVPGLRLIEAALDGLRIDVLLAAHAVCFSHSTPCSKACAARYTVPSSY